MEILVTTAIIGGIGLVCAVLLTIVARKFGVKDDPKIAAIADVLPQINCGVCGFAGCAAYAKAIAEKAAPPNLCMPGGVRAAAEIGLLMGQKVKLGEPDAAIVLCGGGSKARYRYNGITDCIAAQAIHGGDKSCAYGCLGYGSCARVCPRNAIEIKDGLARVIKERCIACAVCVKSCPRHLIRLVPAKYPMHVLCSSRDKGSDVREFCTKGCIGCTICTKIDPVFVMDGFLATVDYTQPPVANEDVIVRCPRKCIKRIEDWNEELGERR